MINYYAISAEHIPQSKAMAIRSWAEDRGISVSRCYMDELFTNHMHMVVYTNGDIVSELQDYIYSLNDGDYCSVELFKEPEEEPEEELYWWE